MPSERGRNHMNLPWILKLGYLFYLLTLAYAAPTSDLAPALSPRPDTETDLLYALDQDEGNPLVKRRLNRYATGWPIGRDLHRNKIYAFGPSINSLPRGIVTVGGRINGGSTGEIHLASLLTFNQPREVRQNTESRKWGGKPVGDEQAQNNLVAKLSELSQTYRAARITESLEARNIVPRVYTALKVPPNCDNGVPYWSLVVMERMDEDAAHALRDYSKGRASRGFNRLSLMKQFVGGLDYAHDLGIAHDDPHLNNLMRHAGSNRWKIIDWDFATDYGRKPANIREIKDFADDVMKVGLSLLQAAVPTLLLDDRQMSRLYHFAWQPRSASNIREGLADLFDLEKNPEFLKIVSKAICRQMERLTMKELYSALRKFPGNDLPWYE